VTPHDVVNAVPLALAVGLALGGLLLVLAAWSGRD
jgi:hypothetical protein